MAPCVEHARYAHSLSFDRKRPGYSSLSLMCGPEKRPVEGEAMKIRRTHVQRGQRALPATLRVLALGVAVLLIGGFSPAQGASSEPADAHDISSEELTVMYEEALADFIDRRNEALCPLVNEGEVTLSGPNIVCYGQTYDLVDATREIRQGAPIQEGCSFRGPSPAAGAVQIEIVYDPDTCRQIVEIGTPASEADFEFGASPTEESSSASGEALGEGVGDVGLAAVALQRKWRYAWSWYDEPARWAFGCDVEEGFADGCILPPVNRVYNYIDSVPDGSCVTAPGTTGWWERELTWLVATGWFIAEQSHETPPELITCPEDQLRNASNVHFKNATFCAAILGLPPALFGELLATHTRYEPNAVDIHADGTRHVTQVLSKSGGCNQLLREGRKSPQGDGQNRRFG